jgi:PAS domain S-box-containing protein
MKNWIQEICGASFMPHGQCYLWSPGLIWLHALSDGLIALAYFSIPLTLVYFIRKRGDVPYRSVFLMFGAFIVACGITHIFGVWNIWHGDYLLSGSIKALTAVISVATAVLLVRIVPHALSFAGPDELKKINGSLEERVRERTADLQRANVQLRQEVTEREHAEAEVKRLNGLLQRRVDELQALFNVLPVGVGICEDDSGCSIRTNDELARMLGIDRTANASLSTPDSGAAKVFRVLKAGVALAPDELPMQVCMRENRAISGFEETIERFNGQRFEVICNAVPIRDGEGRPAGCVATFQDVSALRQAVQVNARYAAIIASSGDAVIARNTEGIVTDWNDGAERLFGFTAAEMVGHPVSRLIPGERRTSEERDVLARINRGEEVPPFESERLRKDGTTVEVSIRLSPIHGADGRIVGSSKLVRDISERKAAERRHAEMERKIQETQRLESLGVLAGGVAHDFNNLLTTILGNASLAGMTTAPSSETAAYLKLIEDASQRASELCKQMLAYSGRGRFTLANINLNTLVSDTTHLLSISIGKAVVLRQNLAPILPLVCADSSQLRQIIMNLVINASDAIGNRSGVIAITTGVVRVDEDYRKTIRHGSELQLADYVFAEISDNGCGMDAATLERIFDPFFTTKFTGRGLGLAAVLGIVRGHKGGLKVYSEPGKGTTFKLLLPAIEGGQETPLTNEKKPAAGKGSGCVLIVDDEETVRAVSARMLERLGYTTEVAADGRQAVELFKRDPSKYRLVLLDLTMPHMDGEETFRQLRHLRPGLRVVLMSGFNEQDAASAFVGKGLAAFLQKPFSAPMFNEKIEEAIRLG